MSTQLEQPVGALPKLVARAEELWQDLEFSAVHRWKEENGGLAVGYMPIYVPRELLHAQGVLPVAIFGGGDMEIIRGDAYYQSYICHIPRSTVELGLGGNLDVLDGMVFPAICDVIRNLSGMWQMMFPDKVSHYLDVPQNFEPEVGGAFYQADLMELSRKLHDAGARTLTDSALRQSIALYGRNSALVHELYDLRRAQPWKVPTSELYSLLRAGGVLPVEAHTEMLEEYRELALADTERQPMDQARVVLTGSFCEQPPLGLIRTLERAGCYIVDDDFVQITRFHPRPWEPEGDALTALVEAFLEDAIASPTRYIDDGEKGTDLVERVRHSSAEGVLFCAPSFCDPALLDQPMTTAAMDRAGIPWTAFKYAENTGQFQVIREQAGTFADSIKLWSGD